MERTNVVDWKAINRIGSDFWLRELSEELRRIQSTVDHIASILQHDDRDDD